MTTLRPLKIGLLLVGLVGLPIVAFWMGGRFFEAGNRSEDLSSQGRFEFIEAALLVYYKEHGAFPPTKYQPVAGGPIHSWRILLVPSIAGRQSKYDFSQEWNSPNNLQALGRVPPSYGYFRMHGQSDIAHYLAIGDDDDWPSKKPLRSRLITKGKDRFLLVEYPDSKTHWMESKY
ncbi:MAG: hypothetical protein IH623_06525 [Verrucomicrobia bacterium]|nr:hypothetical protein [Verrucomicrobiota bacterium]